MIYLVINDIEDRGVYRFDSRGVAEKIAANFKNYVFMHEEERDKALALAGVSEETDALFLIRKYNSKQKKEEKPVEKKQTSNNENIKELKEKSVPNEHQFIKLFNKLKECGDTISISLVNGNTYVVSTKSYFIKMNGFEIGNMIKIVDDVPVVNEEVIDKAIKTNVITVLPKTKVEYIDNYMILTNCDDEYSPNYRQKPYEHYVHEYEKVAIDMNAIASAAIVSNFNFGSNEIIRSDVVVKYLVKKML